MDKTIVAAGGSLVGMGIGFLIAGEVDYNLHQAYSTGGYLWLVIGTATIGLGVRVKKEKKERKQLKTGTM